MLELSSPLVDFSAEMAERVSAVAPYVVAVHSHRSRSSGILYPGGLVVTADEALAEEGDVTVMRAGGANQAARVVGRDPGTDIALLRIDPTEPMPTLPLAPVPAVGALVLIVGAHAGGPTAGLGIVSLTGGAWQSMRGGDVDARIELDTAMRRSAEGGLVVNAGGAWLGMAVYGPRRRVLVIPAATIARVADLLVRHGRIARGYLGLALQPVETEAHEAGAMVMGVDAGGPGAAAGVRQGDVIVSWDRQPLSGLRALLRGLGPDRVGSELTLGVRRAGQAIELRLTVGERPAG